MAKTTKLRAYQRDAAGWAVSAMQANLKPLIVLPTGAGKTVVASAILKEGGFTNPAALSTLRTVQSQIEDVIDGIKSYTVQSLLEHNTLATMIQRELSEHDVLFVDEAHRVVSQKFRTVLSLFTNASVFGATATPSRNDGTGLGDVFDCMYGTGEEDSGWDKKGQSYSQCLRRGNICGIEVATPENLSREDHKIKRQVADGTQAYLKMAKRPNKQGWRPGIYFAKDKDWCTEAARQFNAAGVNAVVIDEDTSKSERRRLFEEYTLGHLDVLCSPWVLAEGFDSPRAEVCILMRGCDHLSTYLQCCGRVLRPYTVTQINQRVAQYGSRMTKKARIPKEMALLIDCTAASQIHGDPIIDRKWVLKGRNTLPGQFQVEGWKPDYTPCRPYDIIDLNFKSVVAGVESRAVAFKAKFIKQGMSDRQAHLASMEEVAKTVTNICWFPRADKDHTCAFCGKRHIHGGEGFFYDKSTLTRGKYDAYHQDCFIQMHGRQMLKTG